MRTGIGNVAASVRPLRNGGALASVTYSSNAASAGCEAASLRGAASTWSQRSTPCGVVMWATTPLCGWPVRAASSAGWKLPRSGQPAASVMSQPASAAFVPASELDPSRVAAAWLALVTVPSRSYVSTATGSASESAWIGMRLLDTSSPRPRNSRLNDR